VNSLSIKTSKQTAAVEFKAGIQEMSGQYLN